MKTPAAAAILVLLVIAVFWPVATYDFVNYDDGKYVSHNPRILDGLTLPNIAWAFTTFHHYNWHPATWLSYFLDYELFGLRPGAFHLVNVFIHALNAVLLFVLLRRMTAAAAPCLFVAALFAIHPLHVESVAWISERKDVLSTFFWLLATLAYVRYAERPSLGRYALVTLLFALGLMSKPMLVTFPFTLLLLDYWPLNRLRRRPIHSPQQTHGLQQKSFNLHEKTSAPIYAIRGPSQLILEKIPWFILSVISGLITYLAQSSGGAVKTWTDLGHLDRIANAVVAYALYLWKTLWPARLVVFQPLPDSGYPAALVLACAAGLAAITIFVVYHIRPRPYLVIGWFWYLGTLVPVIGLVQVGQQAMADRYTYVSLIGIFLAIAWAAAEWAAKAPGRRQIAIAAAAAFAVVLVVTAGFQVRYWRDSETLWRRAVAVTENNPLAHNMLGNALEKTDPLEAEVQFRRAVELAPNVAEFRANWAVSLINLKRFDEARPHLEQVLAQDPNHLDALNNYAVVLAATGDLERAREALLAVLQLNPGHQLARENLRKLETTVQSFGQTAP